MLRLASVFRAALLVIVAVVSCVRSLGLQDPSAISEVVQGIHDKYTGHAAITGAGIEDGVSGLRGPSRDLNVYPWGSPECKRKCKECKKCQSCKKCMKKKDSIPKVPKEKTVVLKPKKKIVVPKPKKKTVSKPKKKFFVPVKMKKTFIIKRKLIFSKKKFFKKKFFFHH